MATVVCSARFLDDLARDVAAVRDEAPSMARSLMLATTTALEALGPNPLLGRRVDGDLRELVISSGTAGAVALYRFVIERDEVRVLALRRQRDLGYRP